MQLHGLLVMAMLYGSIDASATGADCRPQSMISMARLQGVCNGLDETASTVASRTGSAKRKYGVDLEARRRSAAMIT